MALAGLSLLAYNHARFGSWTEFGTSFQLWGADYRGTRFMDPRYILFNAWTYLLSTPNFGPYFPFIHPTWPDRFPSGHMGMEEMHGILFAMPVHVAALGSVFLLVRRARDPQARPLVVILLCALGISLLAAAILFTWGGLCSRYIAELCAGPTVLTAVGLLAAVESRRPRALRVLVAAASAWTIGYTWLASADFKGYMKRTSPEVYSAIARVFDYPSLWQAARQGEEFGPADLVVRVPAGSTAAWTPLAASGRPGMTNQLVLERLGEGHYRFRLTDDQHTTLLSPDLAPEKGALRVHVEAPWLYPPSEHPYWDRVGDLALRGRLQALYVLRTPAGESSALWTHAPDPIGYQPTLRTEDAAEPLTPWVASFQRPGDPASPEGRAR